MNISNLKCGNLIVYIIVFCSQIVFSQSNTNLKLWYEKPAEQWVEALPVGNGRLGAMIFGNPYRETIQLNENTVWAGQPYRNDNPEAKEALPLVRKLIFEGKYKDAQDLVNKKFISKISSGMPYQTVGDLYLSFPGHESFDHYYRDLDIEKAIATTSYQVNGVTFKREVFSSIPGQIMLIRISADKPGMLNFSASMNRPSKVDISTEGSDKLILSGKTSDFETIKGGLKFQAQVKIVADGGSVSATDVALNVTKANTATIYISIATNFKNYKDISADAQERATAYLQKALAKPYNQLLSEHTLSYQKYFNRVSLNLGSSEAANKPTDVRIREFAKTNDPQLVALYFQFGRYLLIASSQPGGQPSNLQGIWNNQLFPPWDSKYTVNINTEMNYWPSEVTNLSEMNEPLIQMIRELSEAGKQTARTMYDANGWMLHHNTDIWRMCAPIDGSYWGMWPMGGAWLSQHLWEKYEYNGDKATLASVYPMMKGATEFFLDFLVKDPKRGWLVVVPSISPENSPADHVESSISAGTTMDNQLLFDLFTKTIKAAELLKTDKDFVLKTKNALKQLAPMQIGQHTQLQEWIEDWDNPEDKHRHVSHLYGAFPGSQISPYRTPELFEAARNSLIYRGDPSTGWSMNWKINLWARFQDGNHAYKLMTDQISLVEKCDYNNLDYGGKGGTYPNMLDACPPFQIDGNFGFTAGVTEMLMQSHDGAIHVLPALPDVWKSGSVKGLRARGGFIIEEMDWKDGKISKLIIKSTLGGNCRIRSFSELKGVGSLYLLQANGVNSNLFYQLPATAKPVISEKAKLNGITLKTAFMYDFKTNAGQEYTLIVE
ncbi:MAG: glycoside hydrolase family 95 protein [Paludibacter sp.]